MKGRKKSVRNAHHMLQQVSLLGPTGGQEVRRDQVVRDRPHREGRGEQGPVRREGNPHSGSLAVAAQDLTRNCS